MGINLHGLAQGLGLVGPSQQLPQPNPNPSFTMTGYPQVSGGLPVNPQGGGMSPNVLLGAQTPAPAAGDVPAAAGGAITDPKTGEIVNTGTPASSLPPLSPSVLGMPVPPAAGAPTASIADLHQRMVADADMARQLYHPGSEFGTHGFLRDIVGNVEDLGRHLLGFAPRYNDEKWAENAYGMTADAGPKMAGETDQAYQARQEQAHQTAAAATEQGMMYNPTKTQAYEQQLNQQKAAMMNAQAMAAYRGSLEQSRTAQLLSGAGAMLAPVAAQYNPADPKSVSAADVQWQRILPMVRAAQAQLPGGGSTPPDHYDPLYVAGLMQQGYTGTNVERAMQAAGHEEAATARNNATIQGRHQDTDTRGRYYVQGQGMATDRAMRIAEMPQRPPAPQTKTVTRTPNGSIISPGYTEQVTTGPAAAAPAAPDMKYHNGHWYKRGPNNEPVMVK